jgi:hypothetical protein
VNARALTWAAVRVPEGTTDAMARFVRTLGLTQVAPGSHMFTTADGGVVEICGPDYPAPPHLFAAQDVVLGVLVDDAAATRRELAESGIELVGDLTDAGPVIYQHVRAPDGRIYGIIQPTPTPTPTPSID